MYMNMNIDMNAPCRYASLRFRNNSSEMRRIMMTMYYTLYSNCRSAKVNQ